VIAGACWAQAPPQDSAAEIAALKATWKTKGGWNGRFWRSFKSEQKMAFLFGFGEAALLVSTGCVAVSSSPGIENTIKVANLFWPTGLTFDEIRESLDRLYDVPENRQIAISDGLNVISQRATGTSEEDLRASIEKLRAAASK